VRQKISLQQGIPVEKAKEIVRLVKDSKKKAQASIQGDTVRISSKIATSCRPSSPCCAAKIWGWSCSSRITGPISWPPIENRFFPNHAIKSESFEHTDHSAAREVFELLREISSR